MVYIKKCFLNKTIIHLITKMTMVNISNLKNKFYLGLYLKNNVLFLFFIFILNSSINFTYSY